MVKCTRSRRSRNKSRNNRNRSRNNRSRNNRSQRGGMAPFEYKDGLLLDTATRTQAEVSGLDKFIAESQVLARQAGGTRYRNKNRGRKSRRNRKQRGGELASFSANYELLAPGVPRGVNPQFSTEASVNPMYSQTRGAQF